MTGLLAELIMKAGKYSSANMCVLSYAVLSISVSGNYVNQLLASSEWVAQKAETYGEAYMNATQGVFGYMVGLPTADCALLRRRLDWWFFRQSCSEKAL